MITMMVDPDLLDVVSGQYDVEFVIKIIKYERLVYFSSILFFNK